MQLLSLETSSPDRAKYKEAKKPNPEMTGNQLLSSVTRAFVFRPMLSLALHRAIPWAQALRTFLIPLLYRALHAAARGALPKLHPGPHSGGDVEVT